MPRSERRIHPRPPPGRGVQVGGGVLAGSVNYRWVIIPMRGADTGGEG